MTKTTNTNQANNSIDVVALSEELKKLTSSINNLELKSVAYALKLKNLNVCKNIFKVIVTSSGCNNSIIINTTKKVLSLDVNGMTLLQDNFIHVKNNSSMISLLKCINRIDANIDNGVISYNEVTNEFKVKYTNEYLNSQDVKLVDKYNEYISELKTVGIVDSITLDKLVNLKFGNAKIIKIKNLLKNEVNQLSK